MLISSTQAKIFLANTAENSEFKVSLDLGISSSKIIFKEDRYFLPNNQVLTKDQLLKVIKKDTICFYIKENEIFPASIFSEETNKFYKLVPTQDWPTLEISGIRMHVTKKMSPREDTMQKISFISPGIGTILDTCTGLGYTAKVASNTAVLVFTFEKDKNVIELQKINPWSKEIFGNPKIKNFQGDVYEEIKNFKACYFDNIIHDPPRQALATLLYSQDFYNELFRVLKKSGKIYHYTGDPGSKRGIDIRTGIIKRMEKTGFCKIKRVYNGLVAQK